MDKEDLISIGISILRIVAIVIVRFLVYLLLGWIGVNIFEWVAGVELVNSREIIIGLGVFGSLFLGDTIKND